MATTKEVFIQQLKLFMAEDHSKNEAAEQLGTIIDDHIPEGGGSAPPSETYPLALDTSWTLNHTLDKQYPDVLILDASGNEVELAVVYDPAVAKRIHITAGHAMSGTAYLS